MNNFELKFDYHVILTFLAILDLFLGTYPVIVETCFRHQNMRGEKLDRDRGDPLELADIGIQKNMEKSPYELRQFGLTLTQSSSFMHFLVFW